MVLSSRTVDGSLRRAPSAKLLLASSESKRRIRVASAVPLSCDGALCRRPGGTTASACWERSRRLGPACRNARRGAPRVRRIRSGGGPEVAVSKLTLDGDQWDCFRGHLSAAGWSVLGG